jgi:hypothetical protein
MTSERYLGRDATTAGWRNAVEVGTGPAVKTSSPRLPPRSAGSAVGGIRAWTEHSGRTASHYRQYSYCGVCVRQSPKIVTTAIDGRLRSKRCSGQQDSSVTRVEKE